jgi:hypothetical protein
MRERAPRPSEEAEAKTPDQEASSTRHAVSGRAVLIGAILIPINCYWMAIMEMQWNSLDSTCVSLFFHVVFLLLLLTALNALARRRFPRLAFSQPELLTIYIMLSLASALMGRDSMENLPSTLGFIWWFDNPANRYSRFFEFVPPWMAPQDKTALRGYYNGNDTLYAWHNLSAWLLPALFWIGFTLTLAWIMLCINVLLRKRWMEEEKLSFPIVQIPLAITTPATFANRALWFGFAIPVFIQTLNNLNYFYPSVPAIHLKLRDYGPMFTSAPWNGLGWLPVGFFPFAIGFAYFLPLDLTFSCWFFYILRKLIDVGCVAWGFRDPGASPAMARIPYVQEQGTGAWIGLSIALVWVSRSYLKEVILQAFRKGGGYDPHAGISYRAALLGILAGTALLTGACYAAGMSLWLPFVYFGFYFVLSIGITRVRAELGPPAHELNWVNPERFMVQIFGTEMLGQRNLTLLSFMFWFNRGYRSHPMPHQLEGFKIGQTTGMEARRLLGAMLLAMVIGAVASFWALLDVMYRNGEATPRIMSYATGIGREAFGRLSDWTDNPRPMEGIALSFAGAGAGITLLLAFAKTQLFWWPFHPIGYALANSYALEYFWSALFIGWGIKFLIVRYGGVRLYRAGMPFFLGMILGDYVIAAFWSLLGWAMGVSTYRTFIF